MTLVGTCPHCGATATFEQAAGLFQEQDKAQGENRAVSALRCVGCGDFILAIAKQAVVDQAWTWVCVEHYPLGKPDDAVDENIPKEVARDFREALRCQWVNGYSATAEMCRRAIETACLDLGAPYDEVLEVMIDYLEQNKTITPHLRDVAHKIRLGGNRGAHPWKVGQPIAKPIPVIEIEEEHAKAIVEFTRYFLEQVYVIPKRLPTYDFSSPRRERRNDGIQ